MPETKMAPIHTELPCSYSSSSSKNRRPPWLTFCLRTISAATAAKKGTHHNSMTDAKTAQLLISSVLNAKLTGISLNIAAVAPGLPETNLSLRIRTARSMRLKLVMNRKIPVQKTLNSTRFPVHGSS